MDAAFTPVHRGGSGSPMVCLHGFTDTWRSWELILPQLEAEHDVLALTLAGHAGGPPIEGEISNEVLADGVERAMDEAGFETAHIVGNSLGGYVSLQIAERGRATTVVALAPSGGWADDSYRDALAFFRTMHPMLEAAAPYADALLATPEGRRQATEFVTTNYEHIPAELLGHQLRSAVACEGFIPMIEFGERGDWSLEPERITCPVRIVWGTEDKILPWPSAATRFREDWVPNADWVVLDGIGHCPQLDVPTETAQLILDFTR
ncbi:MAG: alpha/beta hydrolase [Solirubrobacterales bacterium]